MNGKLYGVGVGPGDPELLTLKAVRIINSCNVICFASEDIKNCAAYKIASGACNLDEKEIVSVFMPMTKDKNILKQRHSDGANKVCYYLKSGKDVAFLTLGDPCVYSTYMYIHNMVKEQGFDAEIISGVTSFCAASAKLSITLGERDEAIHIIPATYEQENLDEVLSLKGTKVLMKAGKSFDKVKEKIINTDCDTFMVENCGMEGEKLFFGKDEMPKEAGYYTLIIVKDKK